MSREDRLTRVFVELADTLVDDFDVIDLLHTLCERSVEFLQADAAGLILADQRGVAAGDGLHDGGGQPAGVFRTAERRGALPGLLLHG